MKRILLSLGIALALLAPAANADLTTFGADGVEDRLMIVLKPGVSQEQGEALARAQRLEVIKYYSLMNALVVKSRPGRVSAASVSIASNEIVEGVGQDFWATWINVSPASLQGTPLPSVGSILRELPRFSEAFGRQPVQSTAEEVQWGVRAVNAPAAWPTNKGRGVKVAVVDTGIDPNHPELRGKVKGGKNSIDANQPWADDHSHGTHVAGIIAATLDGAGVVGVAPEADLYAVKVLTKDGQGSLFAIVDGIMWCAQNGMQVVNMSLGAAQGNFLFEMAVNQLKSADIPLVAAAGNDGGAVNFPAAYDAAIAVSAMCPPQGDPEPRLCNGSTLAAFSSRGPQVAFIAPGVKIPSTVINGEIKAYSGTSMAAPHVAGLAALAVAKGARGQAGVKAALQAAAVRLPNLTPSEQGNGLIDASRLR